MTNRILLAVLAAVFAGCTQRSAHVTSRPAAQAPAAIAAESAATTAARLQSDCKRQAASWPNAIEYHTLFQSLSSGQLNVEVARSHYSAATHDCYELLNAVATDGITYQYMALLLQVGKVGAPAGLLMVVTHDDNLKSPGVLPGKYLDYHCWVGDISPGGRHTFCRSAAEWEALIRPYLEE